MARGLVNSSGDRIDTDQDFGLLRQYMISDVSGFGRGV